jgi:paraquat-inducible protein B
MTKDQVEAAIAEEMARLQDLQNHFMQKVNMAVSSENTNERKNNDEERSMLESIKELESKKAAAQKEELSIEEEMAQLREMQANLFRQGRQLTQRGLCN